MLSVELDVPTLLKVGSIHISRGNKKLSSCVGNFNLPARRTCPFYGICGRAYCYAVSAEKSPHVTCARWDNFWATRRPTFVDEMVARIIQMGLKVIRIHESGDLYSLRYAELLAEIARRLPDVRFYLYTKSIPYAVPLKALPNVTVIYSYGGKLDHLINPALDNYARVVDSPADVQPGEHLCKATKPTTIESQKICGRTCTHCHGEGHQVRVCFLKHLKGKNWKTNSIHPTSQTPPQSPTPLPVAPAAQVRC
jgi:hypothetical protein